ncbi:MAG: glycosyltransferase family 2 protein [Planctomycetes bacterium]|nr:glycosyltransferase family 2 protein [Planctomycetota bacterium]
MPPLPPPAPLPADFLLSVLVPVFDESATLRELLARVQATPQRKEIVVVDDGSTDATGAILRELAAADPSIRLLRHERNRGKGASLRTAFAAARGDVWLIQDADLEYSPEDYPALLRPLVEGKAHVVYGSRFLGSGNARVHIYVHYLGNKLLTFLSNLLTGLGLTDMETCYKAMRREVGERLAIRSDDFAVEPELTAKFARLQVRLVEVPVRYAGRAFAEGKKITWVDGLRALWAIVRFRFFA